MNTKQSVILVIEDDKEINDLLTAFLKEDGFSVIQAMNGLEGLPYITGELDLVLLDLMLPRMPGEQVLEEIRKLSAVPVIIISGKVSLSDKVDLLNSGADDYITKPFQRKEVLARVRAALRRESLYRSKPQKQQYKYASLSLDEASHEVYWSDTPINLTQTEFAVLNTMMKAPHEVHSRDDLYAKVWNTNYFGDDNAITVHISRLRQKLKLASGMDLIETVWGIGYKFKNEESLC